MADRAGIRRSSQLNRRRRQRDRQRRTAGRILTERFRVSSMGQRLPASVIDGFGAEIVSVAAADQSFTTYVPRVRGGPLAVDHRGHRPTPQTVDELHAHLQQAFPSGPPTRLAMVVDRADVDRATALANSLVTRLNDGAPNAPQLVLTPAAGPGQADGADDGPVTLVFWLGSGPAGLPSVAQLRAATRGVAPAADGPYRDVEDALARYQATVTSYRNGVNAVRTELERLGARKQAVIDVIATHYHDRAEAQRHLDDILPPGQRDGGNLSPSARQTVADQRQTIAAADASVAAQRTLLAPLDSQLRTLMDAVADAATDAAAGLADAGDEIAAAVNAYGRQRGRGESGIPPAVTEGILRTIDGPEAHVRRLEAINREAWNIEHRHRLAAPTTLLNSATSSVVFTVTTNGPIGDSGTRSGFAKRAVMVGGPRNDAITNLGIDPSVAEKVSVAPNLIARQVVSSRIARHLELRVLADEVFSVDADGTTLGVTAQVAATQLFRTGRRDNGRPLDVYPPVDTRSEVTQRGLSDLQILDAITGQLDRHMGNIFIDEETGEVFGIDNDMAFPPHEVDVNTNNNTHRFRRVDGQPTYRQAQIDVRTADAIDALSEDDLERLIRGEPDDPERLGDGEVEQAKVRLRAIKARIAELRAAGDLVTAWNDATWNRATQAVTDASLDDKTTGSDSYIARIHAYQLRAASDRFPHMTQGEAD